MKISKGFWNHSLEMGSQDYKSSIIINVLCWTEWHSKQTDATDSTGGVTTQCDHTVVPYNTKPKLRLVFRLYQGLQKETSAMLTNKEQD